MRSFRTVFRNSIILFLCALSVAACGSGGPADVVVVDQAFGTEQFALVKRSVDQWCEKVSYCPDVVADGDFISEDRSTVLITFAEDMSDWPEGQLALNTGCEIIELDRTLEGDMFHAFVLHELGHCGSHPNTHPDEVGHLMSRRIMIDPIVIDDVSAHWF
jgi:hypothetical protein